MLPFEVFWLEPSHDKSLRKRFDFRSSQIMKCVTALLKSRIISVGWLAPSRCRLFLANGTYIAFDLNETGAQSQSPLSMVSSATCDKFLQTHFNSSSHEATDALISSDFVLLVSGTTFQQQTVAAMGGTGIDQNDHNLHFVYFGRRHVGKLFVIGLKVTTDEMNDYRYWLRDVVSARSSFSGASAEWIC